MGYLGTPASVGFSRTTKDRFSGDNSTTGFTMSQAASTATDIQVFVDNIRQEPTIAYSTSGATLTFTEAPPTGTNNVYVIHQHQALGTGPLPPQDLGSTDYIFGDDISFNSDAAVINMGLDSEIKLTHVHNTGILLTDSGGTPTLQLHDANESISSDGSKLILTSNGVAFSLPTADGTSNQVLQTNGSGVLSFATVDTSGATDSFAITGTTPTLTIGDGGAEDTKIVFDGNAQDFHIGLDDTDDDLKIGIGSAVGTTAAIIVDENGHVTMPLQSAFSVSVSGGSAQTVTKNALTRLTFNTERFDLNGDFSIADGENEFTAPVTGKYQLSVNTAFQNLDTAGSVAYSIEITTSNRRYIQFHEQDGHSTDYSEGYGMSLLVDMDAGDTAQSKVIMNNNGTEQTTINNDPEFTHFTGYLVC